MTFYEVLSQVLDLLRREGRVSYRALKRQFDLDDAYIADLKAEIIQAKRLAVDEDGTVLVWAGGTAMTPTPVETQAPGYPSTPPTGLTGQRPAAIPPETEQGRAGHADQVIPDEVSPTEPHPPEAERRQLTVLFCDLLDSTALAGQLDPEDLREIVQAYQTTCAAVIRRFDGYIAQYLGDGLLVYFGYPQAHEDDAQRAVRAGLGIIAAMETLNIRLVQEQGIRLTVRLGLHTGLVVVGELGGGGRREQLALGETPNIAARLQELAKADTLVISAATHRLIQGYFECHDLGATLLRGIATPVSIYRVLRESGAQSRFEVAISRGLTPLVGREEHLEQLRRCWERVQAGAGQVVLLRGEAGIGKSRLLLALTERVVQEGYTRMVLRCSPYHQHSALYPVTEHLRRWLQWHREDGPEGKLAKLESLLETYRIPLPDVSPLLAALLSIPCAERYPPLVLSPQRQKQKTVEALMRLLVEEAERQAVLLVCEDLHWADPSTLELLGLCMDQTSTARLLILLTLRPEFSVPWPMRSYMTQITLGRLSRTQVEGMIAKLTEGKVLPPEIIEQIIARTDGIPLFVEELTKMVLESGLLEEEQGHYVRMPGRRSFPEAIPATLHDSLMARLDRLVTAKGVAQLGATLGREFSYELIQAVSPTDEETLRRALGQLVEAELVYQRGVSLQARYVFKHALIQEVAYQSLLRSTRQQYHRKIAQVLESRFPETVEIQPELLAHHYTEAGLGREAIDYWQRAGQRALRRSANVEAISHLTKALELLKPLPDTLGRAQHELTLQLTLGAPLTAVKGYAAPEVGAVYTRARELCQQLGKTQPIPVLFGLWRFYLQRGELQKARTLGEECLSLAQREQDSADLLRARNMLAVTLFYLGEFVVARVHLEQGLALYPPKQRRVQAFVQNPVVVCLSYAAWVLWYLGYPAQAMMRIREALTLAQESSHPYSLAMAWCFAAELHRLRREWPAAQRAAEATITLATEREFPFWLAQGMCIRGWLLAEQGQGEEGIIQMHQGLAIFQATGAELGRSHYLALPAKAYGQAGQAEEGLRLLTEALEGLDKSGEHSSEAEFHRLKGELLLVLSAARQAEAETCLRQAIDVARHQQAKSWELRATVSLSRLWQRQGRHHAAQQLLAETYNWFTEGFDTADLQEAQALLAELSGRTDQHGGSR
jgi:class 3 adenylate cyclase/predicted ATPase